MGRDSRLQRALSADNRGNRGRLVVAHGTCSQVMAYDLRILEHFHAWVDAEARLDRAGPPPWVRSVADVDRVIAGIKNAQITVLHTALTALGVPWRWCAEALIRVYFPVMRHNVQHPDAPKMVKVSAGIIGLPRGQAPPRGGNDVAEDVRWWYRHRIKSPTDSIHALAEEYATREKRVTDARSVVQTGISRAETLLNMVITP